MLRAVCRFAPEGTLTLLGTTWPLTDATRRRVYKDMNRFVSRHEWARCRPAVWALIEENQHHVPRGYIEEHCSLMNGEELRELHASGLVEIGAHTVTHPHLPTVSDHELEQEVRGSRDILGEAIGRRIRTFAYPSGVYGRREVALVAASGFDCAFAVTAAGWSPFEIPRVGVYSSSLSVLRVKAHLNELAPTQRKTWLVSAMSQPANGVDGFRNILLLGPARMPQAIEWRQFLAEAAGSCVLATLHDADLSPADRSSVVSLEPRRDVESGPLAVFLAESASACGVG